jgi:hypothetical protein
MSKQTVGLNKTNALIVNTDRSKIFLRDNRYQKGNDMNNSSYDPWELPAGTVVGRIASSGDIVPCSGASTDGSQYPIGLLADDVSIDAGDTKEVTFVDMGDVASDKIDFYRPEDTLSSIPSGSTRQMRDHLQMMGIKIIPVNEMTQTDNQ